MTTRGSKTTLVLSRSVLIGLCLFFMAVTNSLADWQAPSHLHGTASAETPKAKISGGTAVPSSSRPQGDSLDCVESNLIKARNLLKDKNADTGKVLEAIRDLDILKNKWPHGAELNKRKSLTPVSCKTSTDIPESFTEARRQLQAAQKIAKANKSFDRLEFDIDLATSAVAAAAKTPSPSDSSEVGRGASLNCTEDNLKWINASLKKLQSRPKQGLDAAAVLPYIEQAQESLRDIKNKWPTVGHFGRSPEPDSCAELPILSTEFQTAKSQLNTVLQQTKVQLGVNLQVVTSDTSLSPFHLETGLNDAIKAVTDAVSQISPPTQGAGSNELDALDCAESNLANAKTLLNKRGASVGSDGDTTATEKIEEALQSLQGIIAGWPTTDGKRKSLSTVSCIEQNDIQEALDKAKGQLEAAKKVVTADQEFDSQLSQGLNTTIAEVTDASKSLAHLPEDNEFGRANIITLVCSGLVFLLSVGIAFWSHQTFAQMKQRMADLIHRVKELDRNSKEATSALEELQDKVKGLSVSLKAQDAELKRQQAESSRAKETPSEGQISSSTQPSADEPRTVRQSDPPKAPVPIPIVRSPEPVVRNPVADYNNAREMRPSERVDAFREWYPSQRRLDCLAESNRTSSDLSKIRFKEDPLGNLFVIFEKGKAFLFPNLTYGYDTGRTVLEGIFTYTSDVSSSSRIIAPAIVEQDGDEWKLIVRGQIGA